MDDPLLESIFKEHDIDLLSGMQKLMFNIENYINKQGSGMVAYIDDKMFCLLLRLQNTLCPYQMIDNFFEIISEGAIVDMFSVKEIESWLGGEELPENTIVRLTVLKAYFPYVTRFTGRTIEQKDIHECLSAYLEIRELMAK